MPGGGWTSDPEEEGAWQEPHVSVLLMVASVVGDVGGMSVEVLVDPGGLSGDEQTLQTESFQNTNI